MPGDTVWWHTDICHAVGDEHAGKEYASVIYIGSAPDCAKNRAYLPKQRGAFLDGPFGARFRRDGLRGRFQGPRRRGRPDRAWPGRWVFDQKASTRSTSHHLCSSCSGFQTAASRQALAFGDDATLTLFKTEQIPARPFLPLQYLFPTVVDLRVPDRNPTEGPGIRQKQKVSVGCTGVRAGDLEA